MTLADLKTKLESIQGFSGKVAYRSWPEGDAPDLPYICYYVDGDNNMAADNKVYLKVNVINIELYTEHKSLVDEQKVEEMLDSLELPYSKYEQYIEDEKMYQITYEVEV